MPRLGRIERGEDIGIGDVVVRQRQVLTLVGRAPVLRGVWVTPLQ